MNNNDMLRTLQEICSFASVAEPYNPGSAAPFGEAVNGALEYILEACRSMGFRTKNCSHLCGWAEIGEGEELIGILAHLDVVPAGSGWRLPPFAATLEGDRIYGRGVTDDKGPAAAVIYAMKDLLDAGIPLRRRIRIIFGCTEESGDWIDMKYYREHEELPTMGFTPDADFPAIHGEKGILIGTICMPKAASGILEASGGSAPNMVPDSAEALVLQDGIPVRFTAKGVSAHGSMPQDGVNAISALMEQLADTGCPLADFYNELIGMDYNGGSLCPGFEDALSGKLTLNVGMLSADEDTVSLAIDIRYPVTCSYEAVVTAINSVLEPRGMALTVAEHMAPVYQEKDSPLITRLVDTYRRVTGLGGEAMVIGGGTYARAMDNIVAFGPMLPGRELTEHQANEYILAEDFYLLRDIYREALKELAG